MLFERQHISVYERKVLNNYNENYFEKNTILREEWTRNNPPSLRLKNLHLAKFLETCRLQSNLLLGICNNWGIWKKDGVVCILKINLRKTDVRELKNFLGFEHEITILLLNNFWILVWWSILTLQAFNWSWHNLVEDMVWTLECLLGNYTSLLQ